MYTYNTFKELKELVNEEHKEIWEIIQMSDMEENERTREKSFEKMKCMYQAMKEADKNYEGTLKSASKRAGGDGEKLHKYNNENKNLCGHFVGLVMEKAIKMGESNACMRRIVAAPTAGACGVLPAVLISYQEEFKVDDNKMGESNACMRRIVAAPTAGACGVLPAVLISYQEEFKVDDNKMVKAMYVAAGIGKIIATNAFIAGAAGGCQAEIGSASAMAAGTLAFLQGGNIEKIGNAIAFALKNMLGLTCDPVAGLVEVPCIKRNSHGAVNAVASAQLAMANIESTIEVDDVIDSMRRIGISMSPCLKETSTGGLAVTESAQRYMK